MRELRAVLTAAASHQRRMRRKRPRLGALEAFNRPPLWTLPIPTSCSVANGHRRIDLHPAIGLMAAPQKRCFGGFSAPRQNARGGHLPFQVARASASKSSDGCTFQTETTCPAAYINSAEETLGGDQWWRFAPDG